MTPLWTGHDMLEATGGTAATPFAATGVSIDTRTLQPGDLFVALRGEAGDGHDFVAEALARGAAGAMVHRHVPDTAGLLLVDDTLAALHRLGAYARGRFGGRLAAVTGSVGKTTTKEMLRTILGTFGRTHVAVASYNNHWGLPLTLARLPPDSEFCVVEIGMNHPGEIAPLARLARPHVAVITSVEKAHIGFLGSIEAIADEKAAILQGLQTGGVAVLPADTPLLPRLRAVAGAARIVTFGAAPSADVRLVNLAMDADGSDVEADVEDERLAFRLRAAGRHMAMNALAALAAAQHLSGKGAEPIARALQGFVPVAGRGARRQIALPGGTAMLLDESYNGNPASMRAALAVLRLQPAKRRIAVLGDMLELGDAGPAEHRALAADVAAAADRLFTCGPLMAELFAAVPQPMRGAHAQDSASLAPILARSLAPGDAILIKGSLGSRMKLVVNALEQRAEAA
ncbi:MAG TPA: UDP-N-acetylmuramoyl-tripeptide--D-alanyl-D-alanine ligase [Acetobacteraceae bacterium]|jgi:UDP-N-acetylmuramoyl-tripeptide--D-alanyl-D-alanine ligase|nr:UDP-N-acetylmuramoyl-tripeptide--D-alanyl-D-alanine ligase [Acetobacteraceae bacterium]